MTLTNEQREEMRQCVVGPCTDVEKQYIRDQLPLHGEKIEIVHNSSEYPNWKWASHFKEWIPSSDYWSLSNISAQDFIDKYLSDATK